jgi:hypothetical protein
MEVPIGVSIGLINPNPNPISSLNQNSNEYDALSFKVSTINKNINSIWNRILFFLNLYEPPNKILPNYWMWRYGLKHFLLSIVTIILFIVAIFVYKLNTHNSIYCTQKLFDDFSTNEQHIFDPVLYYLGHMSFPRMVRECKLGYLLSSPEGFTDMNNLDDYNLPKTIHKIYLAINEYINNNIAFFLHIYKIYATIIQTINKHFYSNWTKNKN